MSTIERHNAVQYYLQSAELGTVAIQPPNGWANDYKTIEKDKDSKGFTVKNEIGLDFYGDAVDYLLQASRSFGVQIRVNLIKYTRDRRSKHQAMKLSYVLEIDIESIEYDGKKQSLKCKAVEGGLFTEINDRISEEYDIFDNFSADGTDIGPMPMVNFQPVSRSLFLESKLESRKGASYIFQSGRWSSEFVHFHMGVPMDITYSSHPDDLTTVPFALADDKGHAEPAPTVGAGQRISDQFFFLAERDLQLDLDFSIDFEIVSRSYNDADPPRNFLIQLRRSEGDNVSLVETIELANYGDPMNLVGQRKQLNYSATLDVKEGESLAIVFYATVFASGGGSNNHLDLEIKIYESSITLVDDTPFNVTTGKAVTFFELMDRLTAKITGKPKLFRSSVFEPGGIYGDVICDNGYLCRGFPLVREEEGEEITIQMVSSWEDAFKAASYIEPMAWWTEVEGEKQVLRMEPAKRTMENFVGIDLGQIDEFVEKPSGNDFFSKIISGMDKSVEYEEVNGTREYNGKSEIATPISKGKQIYEMVTPFRIDSVGYETIRRKPFSEYPSEDTDRDEDIWMHWAKRIGPTYTHKVWSDDFDEAPKGIFSPETAWNLYLSPFNRALYGHGYSINRCTYFFPNKLLKFNSSNGNANLVTRTGGFDLFENGSVRISKLEQPYIEPTLYNLSLRLTDNILDALDGYTEINGMRIPNYFGLVKFAYRGSNYFGRLIKIETDEQTKVELISSH